MRTVTIRLRIAALAAPVVATTVATTAIATAMATPASASQTRSQAPAGGQVWHQVTANGLENFADVGLAVAERRSSPPGLVTDRVSASGGPVADPPQQESATHPVAPSRSRSSRRRGA